MTKAPPVHQIQEWVKTEFDTYCREHVGAKWADHVFHDLPMPSDGSLPHVGIHEAVSPCLDDLYERRSIAVFDYQRAAVWTEAQAEGWAGAHWMGDTPGELIAQRFVQAPTDALFSIMAGALCDEALSTRLLDAPRPMFCEEHGNLLDVDGRGTTENFVRAWSRVDASFAERLHPLDVPSFGMPEYVVVMPTWGLRTLHEAAPLIPARIAAHGYHHKYTGLDDAWLVFRVGLHGSMKPFAGYRKYVPTVLEERSGYVAWTMRMGAGWYDHRTALRLQFHC